jgi:hypothetical protein
MRRVLTAIGLFAWLGSAAAEPAAAPEAQQLPPIDVTGKPSPLNGNRQRLEKETPCLGCDADTGTGKAEAQQGLLMRLLHYTVLPSEPPDDRDRTPISLTDPPLKRFDVKQNP